MRVVSLHEGVSPERVREATGFEIELPPDAPRTLAPSAEELVFLRERVNTQATLRAGR